MSKNKILNEEGTRVQLLNDGFIRIDTSLPKYQVEKPKNNETELSFPTMPNGSENFENLYSYETLKKYFIENSEFDIKDFNVTMSDKMRDTISKTRALNNNGSRFIIRDNNLFNTNSFVSENVSQINDSKNEENKKVGLFEKIKKYFNKSKNDEVKQILQNKEKEVVEKFDVIGFFNDVKLSKEEYDEYKNRIVEYVNLIGYAEKSGQKALKARLFEQLIINKYESILYSKDYYKVLTEKRLVELVQKAPKQLSLDYIENYTRTIPIEVLKKKIEADKMEVFDNYVILHYDVDGLSTAKTNEEKAEEIRRAKDPILFGVISGSTNLYYIDDWIDEYCDLQFETIVDIFGKEVIEKDFLTDKIK